MWTLIYLAIAVYVTQRAARFIADDMKGEMDWADWMMVAVAACLAGIFWPFVILGWIVTYSARKSREAR